MNYSENILETRKQKEAYLDSFEKLIQFREAEAEKKRDEYINGVIENSDQYRKELRSILGWPLNVEMKAEMPEAKLAKLSDEKDFRIYRMEIRVFEDISLYGLLFQKKESRRRPMVFAIHGKWGSPELVAGFFENDKGSYNAMIDRLLQYDFNVFAPQMLVWHDNKPTRNYGVPFDRVDVDLRLKKTGSSAAAVEISVLMRAMDYFEKQSYVSQFGMVGHSYGGFYTLYTQALDKRIKSSICCAYFNKNTHQVMYDWSWSNSLNKFANAEVAALVYPRKICIQMGNQDPLFDAKDTVSEYERLHKLFQGRDFSWAELKVFDGGHEFCKDDTFIRELVDCLSSEDNCKVPEREEIRVNDFAPTTGKMTLFCKKGRCKCEN